jgi:uncharacterized protein (TIGR03437 family)
MSALRGLFLRSSLITSLAKSPRFRIITLSLLLIGLSGVLAVSTKLNLSGFAARRLPAENGSSPVPTAIEKLPPMTARGPVLPANAKAASFAPLQGCTLNCSATVPATGQNGVAVQFLSSASATGCSAQPTYDWNFGDGTARSSEQNPTHAYTTAGVYTWTLTSSVGSGSTMIDTVAGGLGEGNTATQAPFGILAAVARDPQGRGIYVADAIGNTTLIRFINTSSSTQTIAGRAIAAGTVRAIAGGGLDTGDNVPGLQADLGAVTGLGVSGSGDLVYFANQVDAQVRAVNVSANSITISGQAIGSGRMGTLGSNFGTALHGLAVNASTGDVYVCDSTAGVNKVLRVPGTGGTPTTVAGNGATTKPEDAFSGGPALNLPLLQPRAVEIDGAGNVLVADTGHGRVIRIDGGGNASLVHQFPVIVNGINQNPYPSGLAIVGGSVYAANGNAQTIARVTGGAATIAGTAGQACDYSVSNCGDDGAALSAGFNMMGSTGTPPLASIEGDQNGLFVLDQGVTGRGRVRYINLTGGSVTVAGLTIAPGVIRTIAGSGLASPYDGGLATGASFNTPVGVAVDSNGNLWVSDTIAARLRYVNRSASPVTIFAGTPAAQTVPAGGIVTVNKNVGSGANDGVPAIQAAFDSPQGLFVTSQGIYVADSKSGPQVPPQFSGRRTSLIRFINTTSAPVTLFAGSGSPITVPPGHILKIAGGGESTIGNGDGSFATAAKFIGAADLAVASNGTIYVADVGQKAVRKIDGNTGVVSSLNLPSGAKQYTGVGFDASGRLLVANYDDNTVLRESSPGSGSFSNFATGFNKPRDVAGAADGTAYVTNGPASSASGNHQIIRIDAAGATSVIAGSAPGFGGDGGPSASGQLSLAPSPLVVGSGATNQLPQTVNLVVGQNGEVLFTDSNNNRIRRIGVTQVTCVRTGQITITGDNPVPTLTSINPMSALVNSGAFTLTVNGTSFAPSSAVRWNGQDRPTTFVSNTQLTAAIPSSDLASAGTAQVTVFSPAPGGGTSGAQPFTITPPNPVPTISSLSPSTAAEGGPAFTLTVNGTGFVNSSVVRWDGSNRQTAFVNNTRVTAQILASDIVGTGQASVTVFNPTPGGGVSNVATFTITGSGSNPLPAAASLKPAVVAAGGTGFTLTVNGSNFVSGSTVRINGSSRATNIVSAAQVTASIPASDIANAGTLSVTVFNPAPGGGASNALDLRVVPAVTSVSAASFLGAQIATESIVAAFGTNLATGVQVATSVPLPTSLLGTTVKVTDSAGTERSAPLFFVAPAQINYQVPPGTADGVATVTVTVNNNIVAAGAMTIARVAPGLISANANGQGVAAAVVLRIRGGAQTFEPVARFDSGQSRFVPVPIDLGPATDTVYLLLYGSGIRNRSRAENISVSLGGVTKALNPASFEDGFAAPGFVGLDQVNLVLPRTLIGRGVIDLVLTVDGKAANTVQLAIQ